MDTRVDIYTSFNDKSADRNTGLETRNRAMDNDNSPVEKPRPLRNL